MVVGSTLRQAIDDFIVLDIVMVNGAVFNVFLHPLGIRSLLLLSARALVSVTARLGVVIVVVVIVEVSWNPCDMDIPFRDAGELQYGKLP